jgi:hypothetical protein
LVTPMAVVLLATVKHCAVMPLMALAVPDTLLAVLLKSGDTDVQVFTALLTRLVNGAVMVQLLTPAAMAPPANLMEVEPEPTAAPAASVTIPPQLLLTTAPLNFKPTGKVSVKAMPACTGLVVALVSVKVIKALPFEAMVTGDVKGEVLKLLVSVGRPSTTKHAVLVP